MERLTQKIETGYIVADPIQAVNKLGRLEDMYEALCEEKQKIERDMKQLSDSGKTKTVTYKQLFANKLTVINLLSRFEVYGNE
ncbi:hypothetical protein [Massilioclostridium coli]|uniref:hypothetical protein n=1 Tax=Massilioclostridium coli TaxID=1870991 RepID=UPI0022E950E2|nr:hypothetical protein [Massilioclostridium coli]